MLSFAFFLVERSDRIRTKKGKALMFFVVIEVFI